MGNNIKHLTLYKNEQFPSLKFMNMLDIFPSVFIPSSLYLLINGIVTVLPLDAATNAAVMLFTYMLMMSIASKFVKKIAIGKGDCFVLRSEEIAAVFLLVLLANAVCLAVLSFFLREIVYLALAIVSISLYVGFAVSLEKVFEHDEKKPFLNQLKKPFYDTKLNIKGWRNILIGVLCLIGFVLLNYAVVLLALIAALAFIVIIEKSKRKMKKLGENILSESQGKAVLLLQFGPSNATINAARKQLNEFCDNVTSLNEQDFDLVVVFNTLHKQREAILEESLRQVNLKEGGSVIDPFYAKKKRNGFIAAWIGMPISTRRWNSIGEYLQS